MTSNSSKQTKSHIHYLDLPYLPDSLENKLLEFFDSIAYDPSKTAWVDQFQKNELNTTNFTYVDDTALPVDTKNLLKNLYQPKFNEEIIFAFGKMNSQNKKPAVSPPHCDARRNIAINYLITTGGNNVYTCFYKQKRQNSDLSDAANIYFEDVTLKGQYCLTAKTWHLFDAQTFHSVKNVKKERYILSIVLQSNPTINNFCTTYSHLLKNT